MLRRTSRTEPNVVTGTNDRRGRAVRPPLRSFRGAAAASVERPLDVAFAVLFGTAFGYLLYAHAQMLEAFTLPEGTTNANSVFMFTGAPETHLMDEHPAAHLMHRILLAPHAMLAVLPLTTYFALAWRRVYCRMEHFASRLAATILFVEAALCVVNIMFSATLAFHHTGMDRPCNWQPLSTLLGLSLWGIPASLLPPILDSIARRMR